jgi:hypothetical protein
MKYFKNFYEKNISYPKCWYGVLEFAPPAEMLLYDDANGLCVGVLPDVIRRKTIVSEPEMDKVLYTGREIEGEPITIEDIEGNITTIPCTTRAISPNVVTKNIVFTFHNNNPDGSHNWIMEEDVEIVDGVEYIDEKEALCIIGNADIENPDVWFGERLENRWKEGDYHR